MRTIAASIVGVLLSVAAPSLANAASYKTIYSFQGQGDGSGPQAKLLDVGGLLYGTTAGGGGSGCASFDYGCGTIFKITQAGKEKVLHVFGKGSDGIQPESALINVGGILYGSTADGGGIGCGGIGCGTVYKYDPVKDVESVAYPFKGGSDGRTPQADLINVNGVLYGTTVFGGAAGDCAGGGSGCGTVFSIDAKGAEHVLYAFKGAAGGDGGEPVAGLTNFGGSLHGTTEYNYSTLFDVTQKGAEKALHFFSGGALDGSGASAAVTVVGGVVYGTTVQGGGAGCPIQGFHNGCGTVFTYAAATGEKKLYSFKGGGDGSSPVGKLVELNGVLYGITPAGGGATGCKYIYSSGCGTLFSITPAGKEKVLHVFGSATDDGKQPMAGLVAVGGTLYGTTSRGGAYGFGSVFKFTP